MSTCATWEGVRVGDQQHRTSRLDFKENLKNQRVSDLLLTQNKVKIVKDDLWSVQSFGYFKICMRK